MSVVKYKNGNAIVTIDLSDGTREVFTKDDEFDFKFPMSLDMSCTNYCTAGCPYCYANCGRDGVYADPFEFEFIKTIKPYTEVALQFNDLSSPYMMPFLQYLKSKNIIANITVNQVHFEEKYNLLRDLRDLGLIKGLGVSLKKPSYSLIDDVKSFPNAVIHTIVGVLSKEDIKMLANNDLKLLILGYKDLGRGVSYKKDNYNKWLMNKSYLYENLSKVINLFKVISFDNLALEQLKVERVLTKEKWQEFYQGPEGSSSMYIDLVNKKFGISSLCSLDEMWDITDNLLDMFQVVKNESGNKR
jgi:hypothetical protein